MGIDVPPPSAPRFRRAALADLPAIVGLLEADSLAAARDGASGDPSPDYQAAFEAIARDPNQLLCVGDIDGTIVATLQLSFIPGLSRRGGWRGQIEAVRVAEALRGRGVGESMMAWAIEECRARGCRLVQLTSDARRADAHRFYARLGFAPSHIGFKLRL